MRKLSPYALIVLLTACGGQDNSLPEGPEALARMEASIGDQADWAEMPRYLRFDFRIEFNESQFLYSRNLWDRWEGRYRTEWTSAFEEGSSIGLVNIRDNSGRMWVDGVEQVDSTGQPAAEGALYRATNDSYWLVAPFKMRDPGVHLEALNPEDTRGHDLHLAFGQGVGTTSGDQFWIDVNPDTGGLDRWAFFLESFPGEPDLEQASVWRWEDWAEFGGVRLARSRVMEASPQFQQFETGGIEFPVLEFSSQVDPRVFTDPALSL